MAKGDLCELEKDTIKVYSKVYSNILLIGKS